MIYNTCREGRTLYICPYVVPLCSELRWFLYLPDPTTALKLRVRAAEKPDPKQILEPDMNFVAITCLYICWAPVWSFHPQMLLWPFGRNSWIMKSILFCEQLLRFSFTADLEPKGFPRHQRLQRIKQALPPLYTSSSVKPISTLSTTSFQTRGLLPSALFSFPSSCPMLLSQSFNSLLLQMREFRGRRCRILTNPIPGTTVLERDFE